MPHAEIQSRKVISSYGGVGSIIETPNGAMMIENFDQWSFFKAIIDGNLDWKNVMDNLNLKKIRKIIFEVRELEDAIKSKKALEKYLKNRKD